MVHRRAVDSGRYPAVLKTIPSRVRCDQVISCFSALADPPSGNPPLTSLSVVAFGNSLAAPGADSHFLFRIIKVLMAFAMVWRFNMVPGLYSLTPD